MRRAARLLVPPALLGLTLAIAPAVQAPPAAAARAPIDMADLVTLKTPGDPQISPDGRTVAFTVSWADTIDSRTWVDIYTAPVDGSAEARPLMAGPENEVMPRWSPDGRYLAFVTTRSHGERADGTRFDEAADLLRPQVWRVPAAGGEPQRITSAPEGVETYRWTPDGRAVVYRTTAAPGAAEKARREADRRRKKDEVVEPQPRRAREFWSQPVSGARARRLGVLDPGVEDWDLSPDGRRIVYSTNHTGLVDDESLFDLWVFSIRDSTSRRLTSRYGPDTNPVVSPDGRSVAFQADQDSSVTFSQEEIFVVPLAGGTPRCLTRNLDLPATAPQWSGDGRAVMFEVAAGADNALGEARADGRGVRLLAAAGAAALLPAGGDSLDTFRSELAQSRDGRVLAWIGEGPSTWADVWVAGAGAMSASISAPRRITDLNPGLRAIDLPAVEEYQWRSSDGLPVSGFLVRPPGDAAAGSGRAGAPPAATIAYPHGGPYNRSTRRLRGIPTSIVLASHGYLVLEPNYRGSRGFSEKFGQASRRDLGGGDLRDVLAGLDALVAEGRADSARLGIAGGSYGGYLAEWAIANSARFKAAVAYYAIFNFVTDFSNATSPSYEKEYFGSYYWDDFASYYNRSPISRVREIRTPVLILHGDDDPKTSIANAREIWTALRILGRPVEFVHYPREKHGFVEPNHRIDAARRTVAWFEKFMPAAEPAGGR